MLENHFRMHGMTTERAIMTKTPISHNYKMFCVVQQKNRAGMLFILLTISLCVATEIDTVFKKGFNIKDYLNPELSSGNPIAFKGLKYALNEGRVAVLRNAFRPEFAEAVYKVMNSSTTFEGETYTSETGFTYRHSNIWDREDQTPFLQKVHDVFTSSKSLDFVSDWLEMDTFGYDTVAAPSHYRSGDYSSPHNDMDYQRNVAFIWHLSKNWMPEWGGALYWTQENSEHAYIHASFNTLILFKVRDESQHFVTHVSPHAMERRLTFNGWWNAGWIPTADDIDEIEELVSDPGALDRITQRQEAALIEVFESGLIRNKKLSKKLKKLLDQKAYSTHSKNMLVINAEGLRYQYDEA